MDNCSYCSENESKRASRTGRVRERRLGRRQALWDQRCRESPVGHKGMEEDDERERYCLQSKGWEETSRGLGNVRPRHARRQDKPKEDWRMTKIKRCGAGRSPLPSSPDRLLPSQCALDVISSFHLRGLPIRLISEEDG